MTNMSDTDYTNTFADIDESAEKEKALQDAFWTDYVPCYRDYPSVTAICKSKNDIPELSVTIVDNPYWNPAIILDLARGGFAGFIKKYGDYIIRGGKSGSIAGTVLRPLQFIPTSDFNLIGAPVETIGLNVCIGKNDRTTGPALQKYDPRVAIRSYQLNSLDGCPRRITRGNFNITNCPNLNSLKGSPEHIDYNMSVRKCGEERIKNLDGMPEYIGGTFYSIKSIQPVGHDPDTGEWRRLLTTGTVQVGGITILSTAEPSYDITSNDAKNPKSKAGKVYKMVTAGITSHTGADIVEGSVEVDTSIPINEIR